MVLIRIKLTLAYVWYECVWRAKIRSFRMHLSHNPNPTHRVAYTCQSHFFHINTTSFPFYLAYYLYALSWDSIPLALSSSTVCCSTEKPSSSCTFLGFPASCAYFKPFQKWLYDFERHIFTLRDSYTTITKGENMYWCSKRQHNALRSGGCKLLNRIMMCKLC